jgi:hypothetical protein
LAKGFHSELNEEAPGGVLAGSGPPARTVCSEFSGSSDLTAKWRSSAWRGPASE